MIVSMTGYGDAQGEFGGAHYHVEIRSLNNRYYKATIKLPEWLGSLETEVDRLLRSRLGRGTVFYTLRVREETAEAAYAVNREALRAYLEQAAGVEVEGVALTADLAGLLALPGVCQPPEPDEVRLREVWGVIERLTEEALAALAGMREEEGRALREDLLGHCRALREYVGRIRERAPVVVEEYRARLEQRVQQLLEGAELSLREEDLRREVAVFADRCDISEELARLESHLSQFEGLCDSEEPAGRRLEFLTQEMYREANTIAAKSNDAEIAQAVVEIKGLIERLKEQVQNVV